MVGKGEGRLKKPVLVLNNTFEPINITKIKRAISLLYLDKAELLEKYDFKIRSPSTSIDAPSVIRLKYYVKIRRREIPLTKKNILKRDHYTCQYCGKKGGNLTIDHVIPKQLGGEDTWENLVCACAECNAKKGGRTLEEAGMKLLKKPSKPHFILFLLHNSKLPDEKWKTYLFLD